MTDESLFTDALAISDPAARAAFLDGAGRGNAELRRRIEALLAAHSGTNPLDRSPADLARTGAYQPGTECGESSASVGDRVGPYKLLEKIGEGGMGEVWVADQLEPIRRRVAIKLIKPGMDSRSVLGRFEAERQALAVMDHPNIAKVLDAGTTSDGRPYFVMELVKGTPITEFCDARKLTPKQRLELFVPVCQAIQHAHMKGIIHRDIKPSNVLVALHDETPVPKVIDFGVAKAVGQQLTEKTIYTGFGALVGTPAYMAPEQATFNQLDVDTRADVYALGVLLYELLAGSPPIEAERLKRSALDEILRIVRDEEPPRPSARLSTSQAKASIAATRGSEPAKLSQLMKGELDWIVMKALEKDRTRRYDTANGLAADVRRYLAGDAVEACPPTLGYRVRKFLRKNRVAVRVVSAFLCLCLGAVAMGAYLAVQATRAEAAAEAKRIEAQEQAAKAELFAADLSKLSSVYIDAAEAAEIRSASARIDADLLEYKTDTRVGLLRLARPLKDFIGPLQINFPSGTEKHSRSFEKNPEFIKLREFQTAAVISAGQEFVPLVPPFGPSSLRITAPPDYRSRDDEIGPDGRYFLTHDNQVGVELWAVHPFARVALLQETSERVLKYGFSPDGKTIYTQDPDGVARFWNTDGTLRAKTPLRPERFIYPGGMRHNEVRSTASVANPILVADGVALLQSEQRVGVNPGRNRNDWDGQAGKKGPADLHSTRTGQFIRRLDRPGVRLSDWQISPDGRWLIYREEFVDGEGPQRPKEVAKQFVIVSVADGGELARLEHPGPELFLTALASPNGKWVLTYPRESSPPSPPRPGSILLWRSSDWKQVQDAVLNDALSQMKSFLDPYFVTEDILALSHDNGIGETLFQGVVKIGKLGSWTPERSLAFHAPDWDKPTGEFNGTLLRQGRVLLTADPIQRLKPPAGKKYHPDLAKLAPDGRFWEGLDIVTEKDLPFFRGGAYFPGYGRVAVRTYGEGDKEYPRWYDDTELRILPDPKRLNFPPELVELWAQVVVGGEISSEGTFHPWDQPTWAAKQRELAAAKPPYADFPFPGWAATEPHLWHRIRANEVTNINKWDKAIAEWHRLTGRTRPILGPDLWRTREVAPVPHEPKK